jgi:hypothetical protein
MSGVEFFLNSIVAFGCGILICGVVFCRGKWSLSKKALVVAILATCMGVALINIYFGMVRGDLIFRGLLQGPRG